MTNGVCELVWIKRIVRELKLKFEDPMRLFCDNKSIISIVHNPAKHVGVDRHFIKDKIEKGTLTVEYVPSSHQLIDLLTKGLSKQTHESWLASLVSSTSTVKLDGECRL